MRRLLTYVDVFLAQTELDAERLRAIGAAPQSVSVVGNLKFDVQAPKASAIVARLRSSFKSAKVGPVLICGSTVEGEEPLLLKAFKNVLAQHSRAAMILAPRHPERFVAVGALLDEMGIRFFRRSAWNGESVAGAVLLLDTIGELAALY